MAQVASLISAGWLLAGLSSCADATPRRSTYCAKVRGTAGPAPEAVAFRRKIARSGSWLLVMACNLNSLQSRIASAAYFRQSLDTFRYDQPVNDELRPSSARSLLPSL